MGPEALTWAEMEKANALFAASGSPVVELGGERYRVHYLPAHPDPYHPAFRLPVSVGGRRMVVDADRVPDAASLSAALGPSGQEAGGWVPSRLPPELLAAWLESRLEKLLEAAEAALGQEISVDLPTAGSRSPEGDGEPGQVLAIRLDGERPGAEGGEGGGEALRARLFYFREDLPALSAWLSLPAAGVSPAAGPLANDAVLPVRLFFRLGATRIGLGDFQGLAPGDILLMEEGIGERRVRITTGGRRPASCRALWKENGSKENELSVEEPMSMESGPQETPSAARGWEELEVEIAFDLGERTLPLSEARALKPGMVLPLPSNPEGKVRLRVNGKVIGSGALLKVDGQVGVRILTLPGDHGVPERASASAGVP